MHKITFIAPTTSFELTTFFRYGNIKSLPLCTCSLYNLHCALRWTLTGASQRFTCAKGPNLRTAELRLWVYCPGLHQLSLWLLQLFSVLVIEVYFRRVCSQYIVRQVVWSPATTSRRIMSHFSGFQSVNGLSSFRTAVPVWMRNTTTSCYLPVSFGCFHERSSSVKFNSFVESCGTLDPCFHRSAQLCCLWTKNTE